MRVFAISDLHLGADVDKPMDVFGPDWEGHSEKITASWRESVTEDDLVLLPGDLSWAMRTEEAVADLDLIAALPGHKVFIRGNHDYWFTSPLKVRRLLGESVEALRFDACVYGDVGICGVRGWPWPGYGEYDEESDRRHYLKELNRLRLSLEALVKLRWRTACALIHYPPLTPSGRSEFCSMIRRAGVEWVVYGHLHGPASGQVAEGVVDGVHYACVSADYIGFRPKLLFEA